MDGPGDAVVTPCGRCRQILNEAQDVAGRDILILCVSGNGKSVTRHRLADLLPHAFGPRTWDSSDLDSNAGPFLFKAKGGVR